VTKGLVLVASYPRSGNTWTRIVFQKLKKDVGAGFSLNTLDLDWDSVLRRKLFDDFAPVNAADLTPEEADMLSPDIFRMLVAQEPGLVVIKVHDMARRTQLGEWLYPQDVVHSAICIVRHPFDVAVSTARHAGMTLERTVGFMAEGGSAHPRRNSLSPALLPLVGSWSSNVLSWLDGPYRREVARYEDMYADPIPVLQRLATAAGFAVSADNVRQAVESTRFDALQTEEKERGFRERPASSPQFFRAGHPGTWKGVLDPSLQARLVRDHGAVMERLGYTPDGAAVAMQSL
jgi:aryl sulfotransferase